MSSARRQLRYRCIPEYRSEAGETLTYAESVADGRSSLYSWLLIDLDESLIVFTARTLAECQAYRDALPEQPE